MGPEVQGKEKLEAEIQNHSRVDLAEVGLTRTDNAQVENPCAREVYAEDDGATMVEYVFIVTFVVLLAIAAVRFFGQQVSAQFSDIADSVRPALGG